MGDFSLGRRKDADLQVKMAPKFPDSLSREQKFVRYSALGITPVDSGKLAGYSEHEIRSTVYSWKHNPNHPISKAYQEYLQQCGKDAKDDIDLAFAFGAKATRLQAARLVQAVQTEDVARMKLYGNAAERARKFKMGDGPTQIHIEGQTVSFGLINSMQVMQVKRQDDDEKCLVDVSTKS